MDFDYSTTNTDCIHMIDWQKIDRLCTLTSKHRKYDCYIESLLHELHELENTEIYHNQNDWYTLKHKQIYTSKLNTQI